MEERPLNSIMETFLSKDNIQLAQEFAKTYKIPERRFNITRVKSLINNKNWDELERFINERNKKNVSIPYELVADMLIKADQEERGLQMIMKMPDPEESCYMLLKIGQQRHAVQVAINNKKSQLIQDIRGSINDNQARAQLEMYLSQNQK